MSAGLAKCLAISREDVGRLREENERLRYELAGAKHRIEVLETFVLTGNEPADYWDRFVLRLMLTKRVLGGSENA